MSYKEDMNNPTSKDPYYYGPIDWFIKKLLHHLHIKREQR